MEINRGQGSNFVIYIDLNNLQSQHVTYRRGRALGTPCWLQNQVTKCSLFSVKWDTSSTQMCT